MNYCDHGHKTAEEIRELWASRSMILCCRYHYGIEVGEWSKYSKEKQAGWEDLKIYRQPLGGQLK